MKQNTLTLTHTQLVRLIRGMTADQGGHDGMYKYTEGVEGVKRTRTHIHTEKHTQNPILETKAKTINLY